MGAGGRTLGHVGELCGTPGNAHNENWSGVDVTKNMLHPRALQLRRKFPSLTEINGNTSRSAKQSTHLANSILFGSTCNGIDSLTKQETLHRQNPTNIINPIGIGLPINMRIRLRLSHWSPEHDVVMNLFDKIC